mmetsp:Transcript_119423/g.217065  ORF Transcript_119423/g.217065 Transcript_119423/m.217065 type:complete len:90 (+) Transcript_119423:2701-2970(+)
MPRPRRSRLSTDVWWELEDLKAPGLEGLKAAEVSLAKSDFAEALLLLLGGFSFEFCTRRPWHPKATQANKKTILFMVNDTEMSISGYLS